MKCLIALEHWANECWPLCGQVLDPIPSFQQARGPVNYPGCTTHVVLGKLVGRGPCPRLEYVMPHCVVHHFSHFACSHDNLVWPVF